MVERLIELVLPFNCPEPKMEVMLINAGLERSYLDLPEQ